ncbi:MAG: hypothetical protein Q9217_005584 [Psora testacea]
MSSTSKVVTVFGSTGQQGASVARSLLDNISFQVRAITRNPESEAAKALSSIGATVVKADGWREEELIEAFKGSWGAFVNTNSEDPVFADRSGPSELDFGKIIIDSAARAGVQHLVYSSLAPANELSNGKANLDVADRCYLENFMSKELAHCVGGFPHHKDSEGYITYRAPQWGGREDVPWIAIAQDFGDLVHGIFLNPEKWAGQNIQALSEIASFDKTAADFSDRPESAPIATANGGLVDSKDKARPAVTGLDLMSPSPEEIPSNCKFVTGDMEKPWEYSTPVDFVHARFLSGCIADWPELFRQSLKTLNSGGWCEIFDVSFPATSDDGTLLSSSDLLKLEGMMMEITDKAGRPMTIAADFQDMMLKTGFKNVTRVKLRLPMNGWSDDPHLKLLGSKAMGVHQKLHTAESDAFINESGTDQEEVRAILAGAVRDIEDTGIHAYMPVAPPESALGRLRKELQTYGNLRPITFAAPSLVNHSPLKRDICNGTSITIIRELTGGIYYGERVGPDRHLSYASDQDSYRREEVERITRLAGELAMQHDPPLQVTSLDKANLLAAAGKLWRGVVSEVMASEFPKVLLKHLLIDTAAMMLVKDPRSLNGLVLTSNMFGDIISDEGSVIPGSLGLLPSASLCGVPGASGGGARVKGLYEPVHGSAPDIAGKNIVNPVGMILSAAMMLRYSLGMPEEAVAVELAVEEVIEAGMRTRDIGGSATTKDFGDAVVKSLLQGRL